MKPALFVVFLVASTAVRAAERVAVPVILDTDMASDVDDVGSVAVLHALANRGEAKILAMGVSIRNPWTPLCLDAINTYFKRPEIRLGVVEGPAVAEESLYAQKIAAEFPHALKRAEDAPDAAILYREVLARQPDRSVVMVSIGFLTNLRNLLKSGPDKHSPLGGTELVKQKVRAWVCMGGRFPKGKEYNIEKDVPASVYVVKHWPTPVVFSGFEIGDQILTGPGLKQAPLTSPVRRAYQLYNGLANRASYDQTAVLYAVCGLDGGLADFWTVKSGGRLVVNDDGSDAWQESAGHDQAYLVMKAPARKIAKVIEQLMLASPGD